MPNPSALPMRPRLAATLALLPAVVFGWYFAGNYLFEAVGIAGRPQPSATQVLLFSLFVYSGPFPFYYVIVLGIWWTTVRWTLGRRIGVGIVSAVVVGASAATGLVALGGGGYDPNLIVPAAAFNCVIGPALLVLVAWICYPTAAEMGAGKLQCPRCNYDLRGQRECRCPECGLAFALGDLAKTADQ